VKAPFELASNGLSTVRQKTFEPMRPRNDRNPTVASAERSSALLVRLEPLCASTFGEIIERLDGQVAKSAASFLARRTIGRSEARPAETTGKRRNPRSVLLDQPKN
jgi:hypothetical protein